MAAQGASLTDHVTATAAGSVCGRLTSFSHRPELEIKFVILPCSLLS